MLVWFLKCRKIALQCVFELCRYRLNPIISPMPAVSNPRPTRERAVNFSFIISHDKNIVKRMESFSMQLTATGFAPPRREQKEPIP